MMDVANRITRVDGPRERFDAEGAACLWRAVAHLGGPEDASRAARTIMSVANQLTPQGRPWRITEAVRSGAPRPRSAPSATGCCAR